jgi:CelD/BcsL family acetyltransferase involved in cellulose biosynthesis
MKIVLISGDGDFDALEAEWDALHDAANASVFQSYIWQRGWWRHFGEAFARWHLHLVTIRENSQLIAIAPFYIDVHRFNALASTRTLRFIGTGISDHLDILVLPGRETAAVRALGEYLAELWRDLDSIQLAEIPDESPLRHLLDAELSAAGLKATVEGSDLCPRIPLAETWEATMELASGDFRKKLRARTKRLMEHATIGYEIIDDPAALGAAMDDFVNLHETRLADKVGSGIYADRRMQNFHREACAAFHQRGWLFLAFMTLNGRRVLGHCNYLHKGHMYCHLGGAGDLGEAWNHSPGIVFESYCIQEALRRRVRVYDFLRGTESYKYRFGAVNFPNWRISMDRVRPSVKMLRKVGAALGRARRILIYLPMIAPLLQIRMFRR